MSYAEEHLSTANKAYVASFGEKGSLPLPPAKKLAVLSCMDARLFPGPILGLKEGDAHIIRNAGGRASDALRSLIISQELLGTREIIVIHHSDCGMLTFNTPHLHGLLKQRKDLAPSQKAHIESLSFLEFPDLDQSIKEDVEYLKGNELILKETKISGYKYLVETGELVKIV